MEEFSPRRQAVLALVVQEYIAGAQPVGSKTIVDAYGLEVSSATIRNEMKALEERGYLTHPHTSAGRVPTQEGYRYFVEHLLPDRPLPLPEQRMILHQFHQARQDLDQWAQLAAAVLAHTASMAALATPPRVDGCRFKHLELVEVKEGLVLLVLVLQQGLVEQQMLKLDRPASQEALSSLSRELNDLLTGKAIEEIEQQLDKITAPLGQQIVGLVRELMWRVNSLETQRVYREGLTHMLIQPEFASTEDAHQIVAMLEQPPTLRSILEEVRRQEGVQVLIGGGKRHEMLQDVSLVLARYGNTRSASGVLGVMGPVRMAYGQAIPLVRYVAGLMSDIVREWYA